MSKLAHVIKLNDSVEFVVVEEVDQPANLSLALEKMQELRLAYFTRHRAWSGHMAVEVAPPLSRAWSEYIERSHWHIRTVPAI